VKPLSEARLRQLAKERQLVLEEDDLVHLRPMVEGLLAVAEGLRNRAAQLAGAGGLDPDRKREDSGHAG
jgi:hypothetical protein